MLDFRSPWRKLAWPGLAGPCEICRQWSAQRLCTPCRTRFVLPRPRCPQCALPVPGSAAVPAPCLDCTRAPPPCRRSVVACDYGHPWDRLIVELKFGGRTELATPLAELLVAALRSAGDASTTAEVDLVLPVPLSPARLAERGYNQAWELARRVASALNLAADAQLLLRPRDTAHQTDLPRDARARNLRGAFMADPPQRARLAGRRVALVDDVVTTGATAREACAELLRAGAAQVQVWAIARTP
jgi:ComF family protein